MKKFRVAGAVGALLDEYERALNDLYSVIQNLKADELSLIRDSKTEDEDCRSIQTILTHLVHSGWGYILALRSDEGEENHRPEKLALTTAEEYITALKEMFAFTEKSLLTDFAGIDLNKKRSFRLSHIGDGDLLMEHALVHILRHRRQIERFLD